VAGELVRAGLAVCATTGTAVALAAAGVPVATVRKVIEGSPNVVDLIGHGEVDLVINTPSGSGARSDGAEIRKAAVRAGIPCITSIQAAEAAAGAIVRGTARAGTPISLQELDGEAPGARILGPTIASQPHLEGEDSGRSSLHETRK
jgi:carbamoyl-phosphate synthase large subunit